MSAGFMYLIALLLLWLYRPARAVEYISAVCNSTGASSTPHLVVHLFEGESRTVCARSDSIAGVNPDSTGAQVSVALSERVMNCFNISIGTNSVIEGSRTMSVNVTLDCNMTVLVEVNITDSNVGIRVSLEMPTRFLYEGEMTTLSVVLNTAVSADVMVQIQPATSLDYSLSANPVLIRSGNMSQEVQLNITFDNILEQSEAIILMTSTTLPYSNAITEGMSTFTIRDSENGSIMWTHDAPINRILGSTFNCCATLQILPSPPSGTYQIRVTIATSSGTAQNGVDFSATPVMAVFSNSNPLQCISIETFVNATEAKILTIVLNVTDLNKPFLPAPFLVTLIPAPPLDPFTTVETTSSAQTPSAGTLLLTSTSSMSTSATTAEIGSGGSSAGAIAAGVLVPLLLIIIIALVLLVLLFLLAKKGKLRKVKTTAFGKVLRSPPHLNLVAPVTHDEEPETDNNPTFPLLRKEKEARDIPTSEFYDHVKSLHQDRNRGFEEEFSTIFNPPLSTRTAELPQNKPKNRFLNVLPYDNNLVKLEVAVKGESDYINASWIDGYNKTGAYIACQGPLPESVGEFWRLIWQHKFPTIVMVTRLVEGSRTKCHEYWPRKLGEKKFVGSGLTVKMEETVPFADYCISKLTIIKQNEGDMKDSGTSEEFGVTHCHYTGWPDHDVPKYPTSLLGFLRRVRKIHPYKGDPLVVHCSAGVGRTGTLMTLDSMLQKMATEGSVNILQYVRDMRKKRCSMVQTESQYVFIHDALNEVITCGDTEITAMDIRRTKNKLGQLTAAGSLTGCMEQFKLLEEVSRKPTPEDCEGTENSSPASKDRHSNRIPYKLHRPLLGGSGYINASSIDGYRARRAFLATQGPLDSTKSDFWQMMAENQSKCLVMVCQAQEDGKECSSVYWPKVNESLSFGKITVKLVTETEEDDHNIAVRKLELEGPNKSMSVTFFHHLGWNSDREQPSTRSILKLCDMVQKVQRSTGNKPITVVCSDGSGRSGTFIAIYSEIERLKTEGVVDVFQCIKSARIQRCGMVENEEQYLFIHEALADFMEKFDNYANFM